MKRNIHSFLVRFIKDQRAQMLPIMAFMVIAFMGIVALSVSVGSTVIQQHTLQASANASALAGAQELPNADAATAAATYSSLSGDNNSFGNLKNVSMASGYPKLECLNTLTNMGVLCVAPANANAIQVKQQITVPILFGGIFGGKATTTLTATATAAARGTGGATVAPYNVAIIVDATGSMSETDYDSQCNTSRMACSLQGVRILLQALSPCNGTLSTCGTITAGTNGSGNVVGSVDRVALFSFPNVSTSNVSRDYGCTSRTPTAKTYTFPTAGATSYTPLNSSTYEIVGFSSDYKTSDTAKTLNTSSTNNDLVKAMGGLSGCTAMGEPSGISTYYAGAIYAAQSALIAEQAANPGSQNVLIIISDGDANETAYSGDMGSSASTTGSTYPATNQECAQAVTAGKNIATANAYGNGAIPTKVYSVAYGAESSGCSTDTSPTITPCQTMQGIASAPQNFFSDYTQSGSNIDSSCISAARPTSSIAQIFTIIAGDLSVAHLVPNGTT